MPRCILYARKSSESEDRQILSIDSQIRELEQHAHSQGIEITQVMSEARSAKSPGREVFAEMLALITKGKADGILCWKLDRLARNPVDGGALIWAIDEGKLHQIMTRERAFTNTANDKFWMQLEFGMAKKYVDDLSDNVRRGNRAKLAQGWLPGVPPVGYLNDLSMKTIVKDPDRFPLVRKMWELVLAGRSPVDVLAEANENWGLRTRRTRRQGGKPLSRSTFYDILSAPFYYGVIARKGETFEGAHDPMVTKDEFDRVQMLLGRINREPYSRHRFTFTGLVRCAECGCALTACESSNNYGSKYTYYYCTKRQNDVKCGQRTIRSEAIEEQVIAALKRIRITHGFRAWALTRLARVHDDETKTRQSKNESLDRAYRDTLTQSETLLGMRLRGVITDEEFLPRKAALTEESIRLKERLADSDNRQNSWLTLAERAMRFAETAQDQFKKGSLEERRDIMVALGTNFLVKDRKLRIQLQEPFRLMENAGSRRGWLAIADGIQKFFSEHPTKIQWPDFCSDIRNSVPMTGT